MSLSELSKTFIWSSAIIQVLNDLFTKLTSMYLIDCDSHCKDCFSFIESIRNMMILHAKKKLVLNQYEYWLFTVQCLCYKQGLRISTAICRLQNTDKDISKYSVLTSIGLTRDCSSQV